MGFYFYPIDSNGHTFINWRNITGIFLLTLTIFISCFLMFYFGLRTFKLIKGLTAISSRVSTKSRNLQSQLFHALVLQTIVPLFLMHLPAGIIFSLCFANCSSEVLGRILAATIAMYPALDPLPNMFVITEYRKALIGEETHWNLSEVVFQVTANCSSDPKTVINQVSSWSQFKELCDNTNV